MFLRGLKLAEETRKVPRAKCHDMRHTLLTQSGAGVCGEAQAGADALKKK